MKFKDITETIKRSGTKMNDITSYEYNDDHTISTRSYIHDKIFSESKFKYDDDKLVEIVSTTYEGKGMKKTLLGTDRDVYLYDSKGNIHSIIKYIQFEGKEEKVKVKTEYIENKEITRTYDEDGNVIQKEEHIVINCDGIHEKTETISYDKDGNESSYTEAILYDNQTVETKSESKGGKTRTKRVFNEKYGVWTSAVSSSNNTECIERIEDIDDSHYKFIKMENVGKINVITTCTYEVINKDYHVPIMKKISSSIDSKVTVKKSNTYIDDKVAILKLGDEMIISSKLGNHKVIYNSTFLSDYSIHTENKDNIIEIYYLKGELSQIYCVIKEDGIRYAISINSYEEGWELNYDSSIDDNNLLSYRTTITDNSISDIINLIFDKASSILKEEIGASVEFKQHIMTYSPIIVEGELSDIDKLVK